MPPHEVVDVLVVGGGLAGATLALAAARQGRRVLVLDRDPHPGHLPYPELLWGGTWKALEMLGARDRLRQDAVRLQGVEITTPGARAPLLRANARDLEREDVDAWAVRSGLARRALLSLAQEAGDVRVRSGTRAVRLLRESGRVVGVLAHQDDEETEVRAAFVVGADGASSIVRRQLGLDFSPSEFPLEFIVRYVKRPSDLELGVGRAVFDPDGFRRDVVGAVVVPAPNDEVGVVLFARPGTFQRLSAREDAPTAFAAAIARVCGSPARAERLASGFPVGFGQARRPVGHAPVYFQEGVALVGDAAHPVSPVGGQGANMAILDAVALAERALAPTPVGQTPPMSALADFEAYRRPANERGLRFSLHARRLFGAMWRAPPLAWPIPLLLRPLSVLPSMRTAFLRHESNAALARDGAAGGARHSRVRAR